MNLRQQKDIPPRTPENGAGNDGEQQGKIEKGQLDQQRQRIQAETSLKTERLKQAQWSREDLHAVLFTGQYKILNGGDLKEIKTIANESAVLDKDFGNPRELEADLGHIEALINRNDIVVMRNGVPEKKDKMPPQFVDAIYGVLLTNHVLSQDFYITTDERRQPILHDNKKPETPKRKEKKEGLQKVLAHHEWQGDSFHTDSRDKAVIIPKITTYITSAAYLLGGNDLQNYKAGLQKKLGPGEITRQGIENSGLAAGEKSFLLAWMNPENNFAMRKIQERQKAGVLEIRNNPRFKTEEQKLAENGDRPVQNMAPKILAGLGIMAVLATGLIMTFGRESPLWKRMLGFFITAGGIAFGAPMLDNILRSTGATSKMREAAVGAPISRERSFEPLESPSKIVDTENISGSINRFKARFADAGDWGKIITHPEIGPKICAYPVGAMLAALNPEPDSPYKDYAVDKKTMEQIRATVGKLGTQNGEREELNQLLKQSFERHRELHQRMDLAAQKKLTLPETITSINRTDGWIDQKLQEGYDLISQEPEKLDGLKVIAKHPKEWGDLTIEELYSYLVDGKMNMNIKKLLSRNKNEADQEIHAMKKYISLIADRQKDGQKSLRKVLYS